MKCYTQVSKECGCPVQLESIVLHLRLRGGGEPGAATEPAPAQAPAHPCCCHSAGHKF